MNFKKAKKYFKANVSMGFTIFVAIITLLFFIAGMPGVGSIGGVLLIFLLYKGLTGPWTAPLTKELDEMCREYSGNLVERIGKKLDIPEEETVTTSEIWGYSLEGLSHLDIAWNRNDGKTRSALATKTLIAFEYDKIEVYMHKFNLKTTKEETSVETIRYDDIKEIKVEEPTKKYVKGSYTTNDQSFFAVMHYYTYSGKDVIVPVIGSVANNRYEDGSLEKSLQQTVDLSLRKIFEV